MNKGEYNYNKLQTLTYGIIDSRHFNYSLEAVKSNSKGGSN